MPTKKRGTKSSSKKPTTKKKASGGGSALQRAANDYMDSLIRFGLFQGTDLHPQVMSLLQDIHAVLAGGLTFKMEELNELIAELMEALRNAGQPKPIEILSC